MASKHLTLSTLLLLHTILTFPATTVAQCPYPCYPPPTSSGNTPPATTMPPPSPPSTTYPPPASIYSPPASIYSPPATVFPYNPPAPYFYGGAPPPPDPVVPWYPYYYKDPPRNPNKSSAVDLRRESTVGIFLIRVLMLSLLVFVLQVR